MAISTTLLGSGLHHAVAAGSVITGAVVVGVSGFGVVAAFGANVAIQFLLPFAVGLYQAQRTAFEAQLYVITKHLDANSTRFALAGTPVLYTTAGVPVLQLVIDITSEASVQIWIESHHSTGR